MEGSEAGSVAGADSVAAGLDIIDAGLLQARQAAARTSTAAALAPRSAPTSGHSGAESGSGSGSVAASPQPTSLTGRASVPLATSFATSAIPPPPLPSCYHRRAPCPCRVWASRQSLLQRRLNQVLVGVGFWVGCCCVQRLASSPSRAAFVCCAAACCRHRDRMVPLPVACARRVGAPAHSSCGHTGSDAIAHRT